MSFEIAPCPLPNNPQIIIRKIAPLNVSYPLLTAPDLVQAAINLCLGLLLVSLPLIHLYPATQMMFLKI